MFSDERINAQCGRVYRNGIFIALCVTALYLIGKLVTLEAQGVECFYSFFSFFGYFFCEIVIIISCLTIFLCAMLKFRGEKDERYFSELSLYYLDSAKKLLIIGLSAYILSTPFLSNTEYSKVMQRYISPAVVLETLAYVYIYYNFRKNGININYSFIFEQKKEYYHRVWKNIRKFSCIMLIPYAFAAYFELLFNHSAMNMFSVLSSYIMSVLGLALEYFFISFVEKRYYDDESSHIVKNGVFASGIALLVFMTIFQAAQFGYYAIVYNVFNIQSPFVSLGELLAASSYIKMNIDTVFITILTSICFFTILSQISTQRIWLSGKLMAYTLFAKVIWNYTLKPAYSEITLKILDNATDLRFYQRINIMINTFIEAIYIVMLLICVFIFVKELTENFKASKILYAIPFALVLYLIACIITSVMEVSVLVRMMLSLAAMLSAVLISYFVLKKTKIKIS